MKRLSLVLLAALIATPFTLAQVQSSGGDTVVEEIIARVNNSIITRADLRKAREQLYTEARQQADSANAEQTAKTHEKDLLRDLIDQQLMLAKAQELGIDVDTDMVKRLDDLRKQMHADSMEDLQKAAEAQGIAFEDFKQNLKNNLITQKVISQEVGGHINTSSAEIQQYYEQHKTEMERPEQVRLSEILLSTQAPPRQKMKRGRPQRRQLPARTWWHRRKPKQTRFTRC